MEAILETVQSLDGVNGAFVANGSGQVLAYKAHAVYDLPLLQQVAHVIVGALDSIKLLHEDWEALTAHFSDGKLLLRSLSVAGKGPPMLLVVVADPRLNQQFAAVAMRVAVTKLKAVFENAAAPPAPSARNGGPPPPPNGPHSANWSGGAQAAASQAGAYPKPEISTSGMNWSGLGTSGLSGSSVAVMDPSASEALSVCAKALARSLGPMAKVYVKEAVVRICQDRPFAKSQVPALVADLERNIGDPGDVARFRREVLGTS
jgi:hypothetical protein